MAVLFYFVIRAIFNADRAEREAMARAEETRDAEDARNQQSGREKNGEQDIDPR
ncbi:hypothetical protein [Arthrobacter sp. B1805]|uniref:hypothetical protein n=1 Tax=Arthrobacter sp. B1805 TaxID=2058892 RepID=UPI002805A1DD|nr:hypothetical protein [Arthrobacter sp. B1805]